MPAWLLWIQKRGSDYSFRGHPAQLPLLFLYQKLLTPVVSARHGLNGTWVCQAARSPPLRDARQNSLHTHGRQAAHEQNHVCANDSASRTVLRTPTIRAVLCGSGEVAEEVRAHGKVARIESRSVGGREHGHVGKTYAMETGNLTPRAVKPTCAQRSERSFPRSQACSSRRARADVEHIESCFGEAILCLADETRGLVRQCQRHKACAMWREAIRDSAEKRW